MPRLTTSLMRSGAAVLFAGATLLAVTPRVSPTAVQTIRTTADGSATIQVGAARATFGHLSASVVADGAIQLKLGYVRVAGAAAVQQGRYTVEPASATTDYEVMALANGRSYVRVYSGSVHLAGFAKPVDIAAGSAATYDTQAQTGAGQAGAGAGTATGAASTMAALGIFVGATAAVVAVMAVVGHVTAPSNVNSPIS